VAYRLRFSPGVSPIHAQVVTPVTVVTAPSNVTDVTGVTGSAQVGETPAENSAQRPPRPTLTLQACTVHEELGPHPDPHQVAALRLELIEAVTGLVAAVTGHRGPPRVLVRGRPLADWLGIDAVVGLLALAPPWASDRPARDRRIGPYTSCPRHPAIGTWTYDSATGEPVCRRCDTGMPAELAPTEPPPLSNALLTLCRRRQPEGARRLFDPVVAPIEEQVWAALANGPKSARQIALELGVALATVERVLGTAESEAAVPAPTMAELPGVDPSEERDDGSGDVTPDHESW
jgi:hypothetical protein